MSNSKKAVKEANKMADKSIRKAKKEKFRADVEAWLEADYRGFKRVHIVMAGIALLLIASLIV
tara:strand:- start:6114 stop:6302 length:189 start_codon:yes stop_codon:yes gene_type:complete